MEGLLGETLKVTLTDGRFVVGTFQCLDKKKNFILYNCEETRRVSDENGVEGDAKRSLGLVMVPGKHLVSVELEEKKTPDVGDGAGKALG